MELRHLRYFLMAAETLHIGRAATRLGISQPPLSRQIHDLERQVGAQLLHRHPRGVTLTDAGKAFARRAAEILAASEEAIFEAREADSGRSGKVVIGFVHSLAYSMLPKVLPGFQREHPGIAVSLREVTVADKEQALLSEEIDIGIYRPSVHHPDLESLPIHDEGFVLALPRQHRLARRRRIPVRCLADERLIMYRALRGDAGLLGTISTFLRQNGITVKTGEEVGTIHAAMGLVLAGAGIAIIPETSQVLRVDGLLTRPFVEPTTRVISAICWRRSEPSRTVDAFLQYAHRVFGPGPARAAGTPACTP